MESSATDGISRQLPCFEPASMDPTPTLFLLSPANLNGLRAKQLISPRASFPAALAYRSESGVPLAEAFAFMSALYFRGKVAYARQYARAPLGFEGEAAMVIAPGFGLVGLDWRLEKERLKKLKRTKVDPSKPSYRKPLEQHARRLADQLNGSPARIVLLGSIATGKYVDILWPILGERLQFPKAFVGVGDMSRGAIMLRAAASGEELEYVPLTHERHSKRKKAV